MKIHRRPRSETPGQAHRNNTARRRQLTAAQVEAGRAVTMMTEDQLAADLFQYARAFKRPLAA